MTSFELVPNYDDYSSSQQEQTYPAVPPSTLVRRRTYLQSVTHFLVIILFALAALVAVSSSYSRAPPQATKARQSLLNAFVNEAGAVSLTLKESSWLETLPELTMFRSGGKAYSVSDKSLILDQRIKYSSTDSIGSFDATEITYKSGMGGPTMICTVRVYDDVSAVVFEQRFPQGVKETTLGDAESLSTVFPSFGVPPGDTTRRGYAQWISWVYGSKDDERRELLVAPGFSSPRFGLWDADGINTLRGGIGGTGAIAIFDEAGRDTIVLSPYGESVMAINQANLAPGVTCYGVFGNASSIPPNAAFSVLVIGSSEGINAAMRDWGTVMRRGIGVEREKNDDVTLNFLGHTSDNGAYLYYNSGGSSYLDTYLSLQRYASSIKLPLKYVLLDSWWYTRSKVNNGVKNWTASSSPAFPESGLLKLFEETGWWVQAHNRYWAPDTDYAKQNGGSFNFYIDEKNKGAVPQDKMFWHWLFREAKAWGLRVYEQDWLFNELYYSAGSLLTDVNSASQWLEDMASGADEEGVTIQYCMPFVRHLLESVKYPAVTQARASDDYVVSPFVGHDNWRVGGQSVLIENLGLRPSKDGFWSSGYQPGNPYGLSRFEPYPRLHAAVATLTRGPVAIADGIGYVDRELVMMSARLDGRLLQASTSAKTIDLGFTRRAFLQLQSEEEMWFSSSYVRSEFYAGHLFVNDISEILQIIPEDLHLSPAPAGFYAFEANDTSSTLQGFSSTTPINIKPTTSLADFFLWYVVPVQKNGWALAGEKNKWIRVAEGSRINSIVVDDSLTVTVSCVADEDIDMEFIDPEMKVWSSSSGPCTCTGSILHVSPTRGCFSI